MSSSRNTTENNLRYTVDNGSSNIESMAFNTIEMEYRKYPDRNSWQRYFQEIRDKCNRDAKEQHLSTIESGKPQNRGLNRYRDVNPYDHSRIVIHRGNVDYINANLVKLERADRKYILTQGPLADTVGHFWLMVWEQNTKAILMLNKLMEKKQIKCHMYWPEKKGANHALKLDEVHLSVEFLRCEQYKNYENRWFKLTDLESKQSREILQFHYTTWPDFGIPSSPVAFLQFLKQVRDSGALEPDVGPAIVHCSAGIGRSGTFCLVDCCLVLVEKEGEHNVSVSEVLCDLRRYRMGLIQTPDQLYFSYQAIIEGIKLLNEPDFNNYKEEPIDITNDDLLDQHESFNLDETPPPLPPRTHSLQIPSSAINSGNGGSTQQQSSNSSKPLPKIPASESFNDDLYAHNNATAVNYTSKDALNNFINNEMNATAAAAAAAAAVGFDTQLSNRPLPPLPRNRQQNSLDRVHESDSDLDEDDIIDVDDDEDNNEDDANNDIDDSDIDEPIDTTHKLADDYVNANNEQLSGAVVGTGVGVGGTNTDWNKKKTTAGDNERRKANGVDNSSSINSPDNELKRRKRAEYQASLEQKVNEMKRKQREIDEGKQAAKKRRSLLTYIAAGVVVGFICAYAYTKLT